MTMTFKLRDSMLSALTQSAWFKDPVSNSEWPVQSWAWHWPPGPRSAHSAWLQPQLFPRRSSVMIFPWEEWHYHPAPHPAPCDQSVVSQWSQRPQKFSATIIKWVVISVAEDISGVKMVNRRVTSHIVCVGMGLWMNNIHMYEHNNFATATPLPGPPTEKLCSSCS